MLLRENLQVVVPGWEVFSGLELFPAGLAQEIRSIRPAVGLHPRAEEDVSVITRDDYGHAHRDGLHGVLPKCRDVMFVEGGEQGFKPCLIIVEKSVWIRRPDEETTARRVAFARGGLIEIKRFDVALSQLGAAAQLRRTDIFP